MNAVEWAEIGFTLFCMAILALGAIFAPMDSDN